MPDRNYQQLFALLVRRYGEVEPEALIKVLCPLHVPLESLDRTIERVGSLWRASFSVRITDASREVMQVGRTGKFIPAEHLAGGPWREIAKGRITDLPDDRTVAVGEVYLGGGGKGELAAVLETLSDDDYLEIDQYGAAAKVLSALVEAELSTQLLEAEYVVRRMPEDTARHLGVYPSYDFEVERDGEMRKVEVKSLWGTNTRYARLIHSKSTGSDKGQPNYYATSSCKFATQDIFAVSLFLRTGNLRDFAFARSVPQDVQPHGLPRATNFPDYVNQNPLCEVGNGTWFSSIQDVWNLP